ncbi:MAG: hypothetical protein EOM10_09185, partial [Opitutae bacterium]|nr:hypothetical protein [Opitutae bacterium]
HAAGRVDTRHAAGGPSAVAVGAPGPVGAGGPSAGGAAAVGRPAAAGRLPRCRLGLGPGQRRAGPLCVLSGGVRL